MGNDGTAFQETETGREEADNLMYEIESAKRQLSSLQGILAAKNKEVASLHTADRTGCPAETGGGLHQ